MKTQLREGKKEKVFFFLEIAFIAKGDLLEVNNINYVK